MSGEVRSENTEILLYEDEKLHGEGAKYVMLRFMTATGKTWVQLKLKLYKNTLYCKHIYWQYRTE
jgi:hypothetical protein